MIRRKSLKTKLRRKRLDERRIKKMIQVIQHGNKKRIVCPDCSCIFTYQKEDVRHKQTGVNEFECFVRCPDCGKECGVKAYD